MNLNSSGITGVLPMAKVMIPKINNVRFSLFSLVCVATMFYKLKQQPPTPLSSLEYCKLMTSGIIAFVADTIGIGSFAVNVALAKLTGTFSYYLSYMFISAL